MKRKSEPPAIGILSKYTCAECGKEFYVRVPTEYVYKRPNRSGKTAWLCSWHCLQLFDSHRKKPRRNGDITEQEQEAMLEMLKAGKSSLYIADALGISRRSVTNWRAHWRDMGVLNGKS